ncbi:MAG: hypothetical protein PUB08_07605 [Firmicutes bacterium]|nr:hypothetical protein [Bacillota bacterium]
MAQNLFSWNGVYYDVIILDLERTFEKLSGEKSGRTQDGNMFIDPIGTFYNYTLTVARGKNCSVKDYDAFWEAISTPTAFGTLSVPYNQSSYLFYAYITTGRQKLKVVKNGVKYWDSVQLQFIAKSPKRLPNRG